MKKQVLALATGLCLIVSASSAFSGEKTTSRTEIQEAVVVFAEKHNVPKGLALALVKVESNYNPNARGAHGEYGLGQIKCSTARSVGFNGKCSQLLNVSTNLEYSMRYLKLALDRASGNTCHAATLYNRGLDNRPQSSKYCKKVVTASL